MNSAGAHLSVLRLLAVIVIAAALLFVGYRWAAARISESANDNTSTSFAPYVDVTLPPTLHFEDAADQPSNSVILGFVVADPNQRCSPSWGTYYDLDAASRALDLDRRIVRLRERGGQAMVSFGGAVNDELAVDCEDSQELVAGYQAVIDRYSLTSLDFDIEGAALSNTSANARRVAAIRALQQANPELEVWFTLPVDPNGLPGPAVELVDGLIQGGVNLAGVNLMIMNYGGSRPTGMSMRDASIQALHSAWQQLDGGYRRAGIQRTESELWGSLGATPMIGQNDVQKDVFTLNDAEGLLAFASEVRLGRLSMWSANRDVQCGIGVDDARPSNTCSGVDQEPLEFARTLGSGTALAHEVVAPEVARDETRADSLSRDDPRTSPYPLWRSGKAYEEGAKVVWQGRVYEAKWWSQGGQPDAPVKNTWDTPWRYLGPVLESDRVAIRAVTSASGDRPRWSAEAVYVAGNEVEHDGNAFRARWWTQGVSPREDPDQPYDHPWEFLGEVEPETP